MRRRKDTPRPPYRASFTEKRRELAVLREVNGRFRQEERRLRVVVQRFLKKAFSGNSEAKRSFDKLCEAGCDATELGGWVYGISTLVAGGHHKPSAWQLEMEQMEMQEWKVFSLPSRLESLASDMERVNRSRSISPVRAIRMVLEHLRPAERNHFRTVPLQLLELPEMLRLYGLILKEHARRQRKRLGSRSFKLFPFLVAELLGHVKESTGRPHYDDVADVLCAGYTAAGGRGDAPFDGDTLKKLYHRLSDKYRSPQPQK